MGNHFNTRFDAMLQRLLSDPNLALVLIDLLPLEATAFVGAASRCFRRRIAQSIACDELMEIGGAHEDVKLEKWLRCHAFSILRARRAPAPTTPARRAPCSPSAVSVFVCAAKGDSAILRTLHTIAPRILSQRTSERGDTIAHIAARHGHGGFIRALHTLGYSELLQATNDRQWTIAHCALDSLHEEVLQAIVTTGYQHMFDAKPAPTRSYRFNPHDAQMQAETAASHMHKLIEAKKQC